MLSYCTRIAARPPLSQPATLADRRSPSAGTPACHARPERRSTVSVRLVVSSHFKDVLESIFLKTQSGGFPTLRSRPKSRTTSESGALHARLDMLLTFADAHAKRPHTVGFCCCLVVEPLFFHAIACWPFALLVAPFFTSAVAPGAKLSRPRHHALGGSTSLAPRRERIAKPATLRPVLRPLRKAQGQRCGT